jgi:HlyD family secretion protein
MDKKIEKKFWTSGRIILVLCFLAALSAMTYLFASRFGKTIYKVDPTRMTFSKVGYGEFREYYPFDAKVEPVTSIYLDVETGGRVDRIFVKGGDFVKKGDLILRFSNTQHERGLIDSERALLETLDIQRNTQFKLAESKLVLQETLLDLNYQTLKAEEKMRRYKMLGEKSGLLSEEEYKTVEDDLLYNKNRKKLLQARMEQEEQLSNIQLEQANQSIKRLNTSMDLLTKTVESLDIKAPIAGFLSTIDAEIGQTIGPGKRIGQIDLLDKLKLRAGIDQYYISKVAVGIKGKFSLNGTDYAVEVQKVYPEVKENKFMVDMAFSGDMPGGVKRGQTLTVELDFSETGKSLTAAKGGFYNETNGKMVYLISSDRKSAYRTSIRAGRQNPRDVEILEGLREGDWIITSSYDEFKDKSKDKDEWYSQLLFTAPIQLGQQ